MSQDGARFLGALFDAVPPEQYFLLWTLPDKASYWFRANDVPTAAGTIDTLKKRDVYVGVGLSSRDRGKRNRVEAKDVSGILGLWADIDIADGEAHKKSNLPPDEDAARAVLDSVGASPTMLVHSGHGLQAWWLFAEPWLFEDDEERAQAAALAHRWNLTLKVRAAEQGWAIDATQDLSRVMRVPGSTNHKAAPVPVQLLQCGTGRGNAAWFGPRWQPSDLDEYFADEQAMSLLSGRRTHVVGTLDVKPSADPNFDKFSALVANDSKFKQSWERTRKDMTDDSGSSYDLSLATIAAGAGWSDQEIADLIVAARRKHSDRPEKAARQDYLARTISKARDDVARQRSTEEVEYARERVEHAKLTNDDRGEEHARKELIDHLSSLLGIELRRWVRYTSDPPRFRMETTTGAVTIGEASAILNQVTMRANIAAATKIVIPRYKTPKWDEICQAIFTVCEDEDTGLESTDEGLALAWLSEYLLDRPIIEAKDQADRASACETQTPYTFEGSTYVFGPALRQWLWLSRGDRVTAGRMGEVLRVSGCEHERVPTVIGKKRTTRSVWRVVSVDAPDLHTAPGASSGNGRAPD